MIDICNTLDSNRMEVLVKMAVDERNKRQKESLGQTIKIDKRLIEAFTDPYIVSSKPRLTFKFVQRLEEGQRP